MTPDTHDLSWLLDDDPWVDDATRADFAEVDLPADLAASTLSAVDAIWQQPEVALAPSEPSPANGRRWIAAAVTALAAAVALFVVAPSEQVGDPDNMVARGLAETSPEVSLKVAARHDGSLGRLVDGQAYDPGDQLFFRVQSGSEGRVALMYVTPAGTQMVAQRAVQPGEADLLLDGSPLSWTIEPGDASGVFVLLSSRQPLTEQALEILRTPTARGDSVDPDALCEAAQRAGWRCDAVALEVSP